IQWLIAVQFCQIVHAANILFLNTWNSKSHGLSMKFLAERLAEKGNDVTIYSMTAKPLGVMVRGVHTMETVLRPDQRTNEPDSVAAVFWFFEMSPELFEQPHHVGFQYLNFALEDEAFQTVMNTSYDLVIADELFVTAQGAMALKLREKFGTKFALMTTTDFSSIYGMYRSIGRNPVINPSYYTKSYEVQNYDIHDFFGRLKTVWDALTEQYYINLAANFWLKEAGKLLNHSCSFKEIYQ
ncbi:unnamed protein product, partial [Cylicocyclus nassatus]